MKNIIFALSILFSALCQGANPVTEIALRHNTYTLTLTETQKRAVTLAKCSARPSNTNAAFDEVSVTGSFQTESEANNALSLKLKQIYGNGTSLDTTATEYNYGGWEPNGQGNPTPEGNNSSEDYEEWKIANQGAVVTALEPGLPCDAPDPGQPDVIGVWTISPDKVNQSKPVTKYFKFYYKITYNKPITPP